MFVRVHARSPVRVCVYVCDDDDDDDDSISQPSYLPTQKVLACDSVLHNNAKEEENPFKITPRICFLRSALKNI